MKIWILLLMLIFVTGCASNQSTPGGVTQTTATSVENGKTYTNVNDILSAGINQKCTATKTGEGAFTEVVYMIGKDMRADINMHDNGVSLETHSIKAGDWFYSWTSMAPQGTKYKWTEIPKPDFTPKTSGKVETDISYNCVAWAADSSVLQVPANINFVDMTDQIKGAATGTTLAGGNKAQMCAYCQNAPTEEDKNTCLQQLGC